MRRYEQFKKIETNSAWKLGNFLEKDFCRNLFSIYAINMKYPFLMKILNKDDFNKKRKFLCIS